jgi:riboflavin kinase/FMN adenylyltransferase
MNLWQGLESITTPLPASSVAIGTFDGLHRGHQALISACVADAHAHGRLAVVFTFDRHPAEIIAPDRVPGYLAPPEQRMEIIRSLGADELVIARFTPRFRQLSPESFLRFVVSGILGAEAVFVGEDFRFGCNQEGNVAYLREAQERLCFRLEVLESVRVGSERVSSSQIRQLLQGGHLGKALEMLGHPYVLSATVVEGEKLGRKLGFPTANLQPVLAQVIPADGVYAVWVEWGGRRWKGACSIGLRPTVGGTQRTIEIYLLDFFGELYGERVSVEFVTRLRDEMKFDTLEALVQQIKRDVEQVQQVLRSS